MAIPLRRPSTPSADSQTSTRARPSLSVVPRRRRVAWFAITLTVLSCAVMVGAVALHTMIAERQLEIDRLNTGVRTAQEDFDVLRSQRAELRSPTRLADRAGALGMSPGRESEFLDVDPMTLAVTVARTGQLPFDDGLDGDTRPRLEPLDQFRLVKEVSAETP